MNHVWPLKWKVTITGLWCPFTKIFVDISSTSNLAKRRPSQKRVALAEPSFLEVPSNKDFQIHDYLKLWLLSNYLHLRCSSFSVKILWKLALFCMCIKSFVKAGEIWIIHYNSGKIEQIHRRILLIKCEKLTLKVFSLS